MKMIRRLRTLSAPVGRFCLLLFLVSGVAPVFAPSMAVAGNGPFFVVYDHHPENKGDIEIMMMTDYARSRVGRDNLAQMLEVEYRITNQWTTELMIEGQKTMGDTWLYTGWRWENRYRLFDRELPVNPMVYVEWENLNGATKYKMEVSGNRDLEPVRNDEAKVEKERILETRLILGKDFGPWTVAFNWINESDTRNRWETAFGYAIGVSYAFDPVYSENSTKKHGAHNHHLKNDFKMTQWVAGVEMYGGLGDSRSFGLMPKRQEHYIAPVVQFRLHPNSKTMVHVHFSPAIGLTDASDSFLIRTAVGFEF